MIKRKTWWSKWKLLMWLIFVGCVMLAITLPIFIGMMDCIKHNLIIGAGFLALLSLVGIFNIFWIIYAIIDMAKHNGKLSY
jgi:hypothetical protein